MIDVDQAFVRQAAILLSLKELEFGDMVTVLAQTLAALIKAREIQIGAVVRDEVVNYIKQMIEKTDEVVGLYGEKEVS